MKYEVAISREHRYGTDSILLSDFALASSLKNKTAVDLCAGCGIVSFMLCESGAARLYAVELLTDAVELIERTNRAHGLDVRVIQGDLREEQTLARIGREAVDLVTANPPYFTQGSGFERGSPTQKSARYDGDCTLTDVVAAAAYLLKFGGTLKMCMAAARLAECIGIMQARGIEPKEIVLIGAQKTNKARLFLISGKKGGKAGVITTWK
ncbi:MAG: methyltransferase [Oscillospiraceae bacterium]|nr:methyltransferase [Oscillospiraceae bacterium]